MDDADVVFVCEELCACRVCLATDVKLVVLYPGPLAETYEQLTGMQVSPTDGLPQHLCTMCAALLKKSAAFRNKCRNTFAFLLRVRKQLQQFGKPSAKDEITMPLLRHLDRKYLKLPYITTSTLTINVLGDITKENESEEDFKLIEDCDKSPHSVKQETRKELEENESEEDFIPIVDCDESPHSITTDEELIELSEEEEILQDLNILETKNPSPNSDNDNVLQSKRKHVIACKDVEMNDDDRIKEYLITSEAVTMDLNKKLFYNHLLNKYCYKTNKSKCAEEYDIVDSDAEKDTIIISENRNTDTDNTEINKNDFFNYIKEKYDNKKEIKRDKREMVDLTKLRVGRINYNEKFQTKKEIDEFAKTYNIDIIRMTKDEQILDLEQRRKKSLLYQRATLRCEECFRGFRSITVYKDHMAAHDPISGSYVCEVCKRRYWTSAMLTDHRRKHKIKYVCRQCKQSFNSSTWAIEHYKSHSGVRYECQHCGTVFRKYASRVNHIRIHHGATECDICYAGFQGANGVSLHKTKAHKQTYQCATCDVHFDNADAMLQHIGTAPDGACDPSIRACAKCGELCPTDDQFDRHVATHRGSKPKANRKKYPKNRRRPQRKCCCCSQFGDGENVVPNSDSCPCSDEVDCCTCPMGSMRSCRMFGPSNEGDAFFKHKWAHKGCCEERRLRKSQVMCEMCAGTFRTKDALMGHQRMHTGEKPFQCNECPKRFRIKELLQMHMPTHTGERLYKCSLCPKAFKTPANNHRHQLVHTKARPHRCDVCEKTYKTTTDLRKHVETVHMKIPQPRRVRKKRKAE